MIVYMYTQVTSKMPSLGLTSKMPREAKVPPEDLPREGRPPVCYAGGRGDQGPPWREVSINTSQRNRILSRDRRPSMRSKML